MEIKTEIDMAGVMRTYHIDCPLTTGGPALISGGEHFTDGRAHCIGCNTPLPAAISPAGTEDDWRGLNWLLAHYPERGIK